MWYSFSCNGFICLHFWDSNFSLDFFDAVLRRGNYYTKISHMFFCVAVVLLICFSASPVHCLSLPEALRYIHSNSFQLFQIITLLERTVLISLPECLKDPLHASVVNCDRLGQTFLLKWKKWLLQETLEIFHIVYNKCKKNVFEVSLNVSKKSNQIPPFHC